MATSTVKPTATATIEPTGQRSKVPRDHSIKVTIRFSETQEKYADKGFVAGVARKSLAGFPPADGKPDKRGLADVSVSGKVGKARSMGSIVVGVEGSVVWPGRPGDDSVDGLCAALVDEGYRVAVREKRECVEEACTSGAMVDWNHAAEVPSGWHSSLICGRHNYKTCAKCKSIYVMVSTNCVGPAPSVHCEVCGIVIIEWGSSKIWNAELMTRGSEPRRLDANRR